MASLTQWTWVWVNSGSWWWTGRPGMLRFMGLWRIGHDWATDLIWSDLIVRTKWCTWRNSSPGTKSLTKHLCRRGRHYDCPTQMPLSSFNRLGDFFLLLAIYFQWPRAQPSWGGWSQERWRRIRGNLHGPGVGLHSDWRCEWTRPRWLMGDSRLPPRPPWRMRLNIPRGTWPGAHLRLGVFPSPVLIPSLSLVSPRSTSLINQLRANPHLGTCLWESWPKTITSSVIILTYSQCADTEVGEREYWFSLRWANILRKLPNRATSLTHQTVMMSYTKLRRIMNYLVNYQKKRRL